MADNSSIEWRAVLVGIGVTIFWIFLFIIYVEGFITSPLLEISENRGWDDHGPYTPITMAQLAIVFLPGAIVAGFLQSSNWRRGVNHGVATTLLATITASFVYLWPLFGITDISQPSDILSVFYSMVIIVGGGIFALGHMLLLSGIIGGAAGALIKKYVDSSQHERI